MPPEKDKDSDHELLAMLKAGDHEAIIVLFNRYSRKLNHIISRIVHDPEIAKDLVQEVFFKLWKKHAELNILSIRPYLVRAAINESLVWLRDNPPRKGSMEVGSIPASPAESLEYAELETLISRVIAAMPPQRRIAFTLSRFEQMKYAQIAAYLNISEKAVEKHISKALATLRTALKPYLPLLIFLMAG